jgi:hypothetical protein
MTADRVRSPIFGRVDLNRASTSARSLLQRRRVVCCGSSTTNRFYAHQTIVLDGKPFESISSFCPMVVSCRGLPGRIVSNLRWDGDVSVHVANPRSAER